MRSVILAVAVAIVLSLAGASRAADAGPTLKIGDPAPALSVEKWVKGDKVEKLEAGKVYVVEFWATWCGPCKVSIPHLTEVAKKNAGKATVIGISIWEREKTNEEMFPKVEQFVAQMGEKMDYVVGIDGVDAGMAKDWMAAAGRNGIPSAFIVNGEGKIAWMGHPMAGLDEALEQIIAGKWDMKAEMEKQEKAAALAAQERELMKGLQAAVTSKDSKAILAEIDKIVAARPDMETRLGGLKFGNLLKTDEAAAFAYLKGLVDKGAFKANPPMGYQFAAAGLSATGPNADWALLLSALEPLNEMTKGRNPTLLALKAELLKKSGKPEEAVKTLETAIQCAQEANQPAQMVESLKKRLEAMKQK